MASGIVTRYELRTWPLKHIWYQLTVYSPDQTRDLLKAFAAYQKLPDTKGSVSMIVTLSSVVVGLVYSEPLESPEFFQHFYAIPPLAVAVPSTLGTVQTLSLISGANPSTSSRYASTG